MPRTSVNYQNTIIYKIVCNDLNVKDLYVGHTTDFKRRKSQHKRRCNNENDTHYNLKIYKIMRENGGWDNWIMVEIEKYTCNDSKEATSRERLWFETLQAKMNSIYPQRTIEEYRQENKEKIKEYYINNKDKILIRAKQNYENNKDHKIEYQKQYSMDNQIKIKEKGKKYREENKHKLKEFFKIYNNKKQRYNKRKTKSRNDL